MSEQKETSTLELADVVKVEVIEHLLLLVHFDDGMSGKVQIASTWLKGIFEPLKNKDTFQDVLVEHGAVTWANGLDLPPEPMYLAIKKQGFYYIG